MSKNFGVIAGFVKNPNLVVRFCHFRQTKRRALVCKLGTFLQDVPLVKYQDSGRNFQHILEIFPWELVTVHAKTVYEICEINRAEP